MRPRALTLRVGIAVAGLVALTASAGFVVRAQREAHEREALARVNAGELSASDETFAEVDPHVAVNAKDAVAVSFMGVSRVEGEGDASRAIGLRVSRDDGKTWGPIERVQAPGDRLATDSMLVATPNGDFVLTWLGFRANLKKGGAPYDLGVFTARNLASGSGTALPIEITAGIREKTKDAWMKFDKPWTAVLGDGGIVTSYRFEAPMRSGIRVARSTDAIHFEDAVVVEGPAFGGTLATICAADSVVFVVFVDASKGIWARVVVYRSDDGGATWKKINEATRDGEHAVVEAPFCASMARGDLTVAYGIGVAPPDDSSSALVDAIELVHSSDNGLSWDARAHYREPGALMLHPTIAEPRPGEIEILFAAGQGNGDANGSIRRVRWNGAPTDAGVIEAKSELVHAPITLVTKRNPAAGWTGDFFGIAARPGRTFEVFGDNGVASAGSIAIASHLLLTSHE